MSNSDGVIHTRSCLICGGRIHPLVDDEIDVTYDVCQDCGFIYKQPLYHLPLKQEEERYLLHHNSESNIGYVTYLKAFMEADILPIKGVTSILDFGSGPDPMLKQLLEQQGYDVTDYDPFFHDDVSYANNTYDLIVMTEVLEHIHQPLQALQHLKTLLNEHGRILIMTQFRTMDETEFLHWWYRRDTTHVGFFHDGVFAEIASQLDMTIERSNHIDCICLSN